MTVTFDTVELPNPTPFDIDRQVLLTDTVLLSGRHSLQGTSQTAITCSITGYTDTESDITNLRAKIGTEGTLMVDSTSYDKCHIAAFTSKLWAKGEWTYTIGFKQDTTT